MKPEEKIERAYEELRAIIDGGSESFTHEDAVQYLKDKLAQPELCKHGQERKSCTSSPMDCQCAIDAALAQPEQETVAWESILGAVARGWCYEENANKAMDSELAVAIAKEVQALYTTPPQRTWVGLTDEELKQVRMSIETNPYTEVQDVVIAVQKATQAKLKEKNT